MKIENALTGVRGQLFGQIVATLGDKLQPLGGDGVVGRRLDDGQGNIKGEYSGLRGGRGPFLPGAAEGQRQTVQCFRCRHDENSVFPAWISRFIMLRPHC